METAGGWQWLITELLSSSRFISCALETSFIGLDLWDNCRLSLYYSLVLCMNNHNYLLHHGGDQAYDR